MGGSLGEGTWKLGNLKGLVLLVEEATGIYRPKDDGYGRRRWASK
jgi:hypothetical protein